MAFGSQPQFLPTNRGFDEFYVPAAADAQRRYRRAARQPCTLTARYTEQAQSFIAAAKDSPFFLYMPHTFPHIPLAASPCFRGKSKLGLYGDTVAELDWSVGRVLRIISENGLDQNTLVMFSSDNGPWYQGTAAPCADARDPPTMAECASRSWRAFQAGFPKAWSRMDSPAPWISCPRWRDSAIAALPDKPVDGIDIWPPLSGQAESLEREALLYFDVPCARLGKWKLHVAGTIATPTGRRRPPAG